MALEMMGPGESAMVHSSNSLPSWAGSMVLKVPKKYSHGMGAGGSRQIFFFFKFSCSSILFGVFVKFPGADFPFPGLQNRWKKSFEVHPNYWPSRRPGKIFPVMWWTIFWLALAQGL